MTNEEVRAVVEGAIDYVHSIVPIRPRVRWGVCDLSYEEQYRGQYNRGIIVLLPFYKMSSLRHYNEAEAANMLSSTYRQRSEMNAALAAAFEKAGIPYKVPVVYSDHDKVFKVEFSVKEAAVRAGLGWIGKNDLLVNEEYGPRFSITGAVIKADELIPGTPVTESRCGDCNACVEACPYHNIKGAQWKPGLPREELVDYVNCHLSRDKAKPRLGRKLACARCMVSCPYGLPEEEKGEKTNV